MNKIIFALSFAALCLGTVMAEGECLVGQLDRLCKRENQLPEALVRPASLLVQERYLHRPWEQVRADLVKQGLKIPVARDSRYLLMFDVPVKAGALKLKGVSFDLLLEITVDKRTKEVAASARKNHVIGVTASLRGDVQMRMADVLESAVFAPKSVLGRALLVVSEKKHDGGHPVLKQIKLSYDLIRGHREWVWPYGYHLEVSFCDTPKGKWKKTVYLSVLSSEDLPRDRDHKPVMDWKGWENTGLDDIHLWGSAGE